MSMCALIGTADGSIDNAERTKVSGLITGNEALKVFPAAELTQKFDFYAGKLQSKVLRRLREGRRPRGVLRRRHLTDGVRPVARGPV